MTKINYEESRAFLDSQVQAAIDRLTPGKTEEFVKSPLVDALQASRTEVTSKIKTTKALLELLENISNTVSLIMLNYTTALMDPDRKAKEKEFLSDLHDSFGKMSPDALHIIHSILSPEVLTYIEKGPSS